MAGRLLRPGRHCPPVMVLGAHQAFPAARRSTPRSTFQLDPPEETLWPNQKPEEGNCYELNWSLCGSGVIPLGKTMVLGAHQAAFSAAGRSRSGSVLKLFSSPSDHRRHGLVHHAERDLNLGLIVSVHEMNIDTEKDN